MIHQVKEITDTPVNSKCLLIKQIVLKFITVNVCVLVFENYPVCIICLHFTYSGQGLFRRVY